MNHLTTLDENQAKAVETRQEIDLRTGAALTRFLTLNYRPRMPFLKDKVISYGKKLAMIALQRNYIFLFSRLLSLSNARLCSRTVLEKREFCSRRFLVCNYSDRKGTKDC